MGAARGYPDLEAYATAAETSRHQRVTQGEGIKTMNVPEGVLHRKQELLTLIESYDADAEQKRSEADLIVRQAAVFRAELAGIESGIEAFGAAKVEAPSTAPRPPKAKRKIPKNQAAGGKNPGARHRARDASGSR
ncbi:MAG: hypothetical protein JO001_25485 [Alphaproteobacteria bacterium]|nr:hypothetical protein [Alphaproteobacteria bacterium]